jgi:DNA-binding response OmpR family regulator
MAKPVCLLIEDSRTQALAITRQLTAHNWDTLTAFDLRAAISTFMGMLPNMILTDIHIGDVQVTDHLGDLKTQWPTAPIAVMTAGGSEGVAEALMRARRAGADLLIKKPFSSEELGATLRDGLSMGCGERRRLHVLVVDDSAVIRKVCGNAFNEIGARVTLASSMEQALERLDISVIDVVVTDIFMPGMGGIEGMMRIRQAWPGVGLVAISGGFNEMDADSALKAARRIGADSAIGKPFTNSALIASVRSAATAAERRHASRATEAAAPKV